MPENQIIEGGYFRDIFEQPQALEQTLAALEPHPALLSAGRYRRIVLTGMGSSFHAFHPLAIELAGHGFTVVMLETSELIHYHRRLLDAETLTIALSQSGRSAELVRLVEVNDRRSFLVAVTNAGDSPLAEGAHATVLTRAGSEFTVSSKTYLASLLALAWVGDHLRGCDLGRTREELAQAAPAVAAYLAGWREHVREAQAELAGVRHLFLAGRGPSLASTGVGGLIVKEANRFPAEGMSAAAFRHGPLEMAREGVMVMVFEGDARTADLNRRLAADVRAAGGKAVVVAESREPGLFTTPPIAPRLRPVLEILPVEMVTLALAAMGGYEAGAFSVGRKVTLSE